MKVGGFGRALKSVCWCLFPGYELESQVATVGHHLSQAGVVDSNGLSLVN